MRSQRQGSAARRRTARPSTEGPARPAGAARSGTAAATPAKPKMRGWLHAGMTPLIFLAILALMVHTASWSGRLAEAIYLVTALLLFGNSAIYHRGHWSPRIAGMLRRFDHSNIAIFIAGTYTPLAVLMLHGTSRVTLLCIVWACAAVEVACRNLWMGAPRILYTGLYIAMGWAAVFWIPQFWRAGGPGVVIWLIAGGLCYTVGAVVYAFKWPNPSPRWFGFHEIFHAGTVVGAACHLVSIWLAAG
ncbi:Hypothetical membrane protein [Propionibacterium freudenreichii]|nr:Hypothetical membrane protein [Propionibacterium freudenreichii]SBN43011.1 Channel protein, hemolysin III family protein [Propionibacterium freudenreichii]SBW76295.1 Channel protein, hemolysin III family protein [Propionibacterium freudenreichii]